MMEPHVFTVVLNSNRREDTLACLASLHQLTYKNHTIIALDNASTDGSVEAILASFPSVQMIHLADNKGYAGNNNVGIQATMEQGADWVFVLNEDTILDPMCLTHLVTAGESDSRIGVVGPLVFHHSEPGVIQSAGGQLDKWWFASHVGQNEDDQGQFAAARDADWISGCAILVRRAAIEQLGALDERFFYYWEETEWCLRIRRKGWRIVHVPAAKLWHKGVQRDYRPGPSVSYYNTRNWLLMLSKHDAPVAVWAAAWWQIIRTLVSWTLKPKWQSKRDHRNAMWRGAMDFLGKRWGKMPL